MITIVTGKQNEGKTTLLEKIYQENKKGDGFVSVKKMDGPRVHSFTATKLSSMEQKVLLLHEHFYMDSFVNAGKMGPYYINLLTITWIEKSIIKMIEEKIEPIYLDEVGMFEIRGYGYDRILKKMIESDLDIIFTARTEFLEQIKAHYNLKNVKVIQVTR